MLASLPSLGFSHSVRLRKPFRRISVSNPKNDQTKLGKRSIASQLTIDHLVRELEDKDRMTENVFQQLQVLKKGLRYDRMIVLGGAAIDELGAIPPLGNALLNAVIERLPKTKPLQIGEDDREKEIDLALEWLEERGFVPDAATECILIKAYAKIGNTDRMQSLIASLPAIKHEHIQSIMAGYITMGSPEEAVAVFFRVFENPFNPEDPLPISCTLALKALSLCGYDARAKAKRIMEIMKEHDIELGHEDQAYLLVMNLTHQPKYFPDLWLATPKTSRLPYSLVILRLADLNQHKNLRRIVNEFDSSGLGWTRSMYYTVLTAFQKVQDEENFAFYARKAFKEGMILHPSKIMYGKKYLSQEPWWQEATKKFGPKDETEDVEDPEESLGMSFSSLWTDR
eukprot:TRINITY_DN10603_c0_g1_i2.p1 TRINITY_DN10603_c0_g1~~TRINITY_DN10603_c0_g1_i2.p1  ORF type:complete len:398 (+),score=73.22 TRINITY_DN10603_c0_g1_i2:3-1196(+)